MNSFHYGEPSGWHDGLGHYGLASRLFHWAIAILTVISFGLAWTWFLPGRGSLQNTMVDAHRLTGITILLLSFIRMVWRLIGQPKTLQNEARWIRFIAKIVQLTLMLLLVVIPISGWIYTNAGGFDVHFMGHDLPRLVSRDHYLEDIAVWVHENLALFFLLVLGIHFVGAVRHWRRS